MDPTNRNTALASAFAEELARAGVERAVISPGSRSTPLAVALWRQPEIAVSVHVDERSAGFFALGAAQATANPIAVLCTSGSAAANLHPAVVEADLSAVPLIVLTADRPPELRDVGSGQTIDQLKLFGSAVRWFCEVGTHDADDEGLLHYRYLACRAVAIARGDARPGPVHLNVAWREPLAPVAEEGAVTATSPLALEGRRSAPLIAVSSPRPAPPPEQLEAIAADIARTERGLILCGRQRDRSLPALVAELAALTGYPVLAEPTSQVRLGPHDRSQVVSGYDSIARLRPDILEPELIVRFGEMPTSKPLRQWLLPGERIREVVIDGDHGWNEPSKRAALILRADPALTAAGLSSQLRPRIGSDFLETWLAADAAVAEAHTAELAGIRAISEPGLHAALGRGHRSGDVVYTASSMPIRDQEEFVTGGPADVHFLANRGTNGIDGFVSSGIGAAVASRRPATVILGDLCLFHDLGGLLALREAGTPVRIVVIDNGGGAIFHFLPQAGALPGKEFEALLGTPTGLDPARVAALFGIEHRPLGELGELGAALEAGTGLISVAVDREHNVAVHQRLRGAAEAALRAL